MQLSPFQLLSGTSKRDSVRSRVPSASSISEDAEQDTSVLKHITDQAAATARQSAQDFNDRLSKQIVQAKSYPRAGEAFGRKVESYKTGTPYVPRTGAALVHKNETIVDARNGMTRVPNTGLVRLRKGQAVIPAEKNVYNLGRKSPHSDREAPRNVRSYQDGTPYVPSSGPALVHEGEQITQPSPTPIRVQIPTPAGDVHVHMPEGADENFASSVSKTIYNILNPSGRPQSAPLTNSAAVMSVPTSKGEIRVHAPTDDEGFLSKVGKAVDNAASSALSDFGLPSTDKEIDEANARLPEQIAHPLNTAKEALKSIYNLPGQMLDAQGQLLKKAESAWKAGDTGSAVAHFANWLLPVVGAGSDKGGEALAKGDYAKGVGHTAAVVLPMLLGEPGSGSVSDTAEAETGGASQNLLRNKPSEESDYQGEMPSKPMSKAARIEWMNKNLKPETKLSIARHELAHADYALKAGHPPDDVLFHLGVQDAGRGTVSQGNVMTLDSFWQDALDNAKTDEERKEVLDKELKYMYAPTVVEEKQGTPFEKIDFVTMNDQARAQRLMETLGMTSKQIAVKRSAMLRELRQEITPETMDRYTNAAQEISDHHFRDYISPWALRHYLNGGVYEQIEKRLAEEKAQEYHNPDID